MHTEWNGKNEKTSVEIVTIILVLIFGFSFLKVGITEYPSLFFAILFIAAVYVLIKKGKK